MSQVDNRNSSAAKRARTDGSRREDHWTCPSCGNVNFSFRTTCNMRSCTQPRPADHIAKSAAKPMQPPQNYSAAAPYLGPAAPSSMYLGVGVPPYGPSIPPYDVPFSGGSAYPYNYGSCLSGGSPYRPLHAPAPTPYSGGSMMGNGGMYGMPALVDRYSGLGLPMSPAAMSFKSTDSFYGREVLWNGTMKFCEEDVNVSAISLNGGDICHNILSYQSNHRHPALLFCYGIIQSNIRGEKGFAAVECCKSISHFFSLRYSLYRQSSEYAPGTKSWWNFIRPEALHIYRQIIEVVNWSFWCKISVQNLYQGCFIVDDSLKDPHEDGTAKVKFIPGSRFDKAYKPRHWSDALRNTVEKICCEFFQVIGLDSVISHTLPGGRDAVLKHISAELSHDNALMRFIENFNNINSFDESPMALVWFLNATLFWDLGKSYYIITEFSRIRREIPPFNTDLESNLIMLNLLRSWAPNVRKKHVSQSHHIAKIIVATLDFQSYPERSDVVRFMAALGHHLNDSWHKDKRPILTKKLSYAEVVKVWMHAFEDVKDKNLREIHIMEDFHLGILWTLFYSTVPHREMIRITGTLLGRGFREMIDVEAEKAASNFDVRSAS